MNAHQEIESLIRELAQARERIAELEWERDRSSDWKALHNAYNHLEQVEVTLVEAEKRIAELKAQEGRLWEMYVSNENKRIAELEQNEATLAKVREELNAPTFPAHEEWDSTDSYYAMQACARIRALLDGDH